MKGLALIFVVNNVLIRHELFQTYALGAVGAHLDDAASGLAIVNQREWLQQRLKQRHSIIVGIPFFSILRFAGLNSTTIGAYTKNSQVIRCGGSFSVDVLIM